MAARFTRRGVLLGGLGLAGSAALWSSPALAAPRGALPGGAAPAGGLPGGALPGALVPDVKAAELPWRAARKIVAETVTPLIRDARYDVTRYGAVADGVTDNTDAFARAITAANAAGGGRVVVPAGTYVTGAIYLKSNVEFHLKAGSTLKFSADPTKYPTVLTRYEGIECVNRSPMIYAYRERNIALTGPGTLDFEATVAWNKGNERGWLEGLIASGVTDPRQRVVPGSGHNLRVAMVEPYECEAVLLRDFTLKNPTFWQVHPVLCRWVTVSRITTDPNPWKSNTDACNPESCDHVVIKNCVLGAHDDNIAIKAGRDEDGRRLNVPCQNIVVFGCTMAGNWGAITCGSEMTGFIRNVYAYKCTTVSAKFALYVKSNTLRGGGCSNINLDNFNGPYDRSFVFVTSTYNNQTGTHPPAFGPITITNSGCTSAPRVFDVSGLPEHPVRGFTVDNCHFTNVVNPANNNLSHVVGLELKNVTINGQPPTG